MADQDLKDQEQPGPDDVEDDGADGVEQEEGDDEGDEGEEANAPSEGEGEDESPDAVAEEPAPRESRATRRVRDALDRAKSAEIALAEERGRRDGESRVSAEAEAARKRAERETLLGSMDESQRIQYLMAEKITAIEQNQQALMRQTNDQVDKARFEGRFSQNKRFSKYVDKVDKAHTELVRTGTHVSREAVLAYLIGTQVLADDGKSATKQRREGARRIAEQRGRPGAPRSNVGASGRRGSLVSRMEADDPAI